MAIQQWRIKMDRNGRLRLPKAVRARLNWQPETVLVVEPHDNALRIQPETVFTRVIEKDGLLVIQTSGEIDWNARIAEEREEPLEGFLTNINS